MLVVESISNGRPFPRQKPQHLHDGQLRVGRGQGWAGLLSSNLSSFSRLQVCKADRTFSQTQLLTHGLSNQPKRIWPVSRDASETAVPLLPSAGSQAQCLFFWGNGRLKKQHGHSDTEASPELNGLAVAVKAIIQHENVKMSECLAHLAHLRGIKSQEHSRSLGSQYARWQLDHTPSPLCYVALRLQQNKQTAP